MGRSPRGVLIGLAIAVAAGPLFLNGQDFAPFELGARASGLAGAFTAKSDDVTALFGNPAGLAFLKGVRFKANLLFSRPTMTASLQPTGAEFTSNPSEFRGSFALSWQFLKRISFGVGFFTPFTWDTNWPVTWAGRNIAYEAELNAVFLRPALSAEIFKGLAVGVGLDFAFSQILWRHNQPFRLGNFPLPAGTGVESKFELSGNGIGFTAGLLWKPHPIFQAGVRYQHQIPIEVRGRDAFVISSFEMDVLTIPNHVKGQRPVAVGDLARLFFRAQDFTGKVTLPHEIAFGALFAPIPSLSFHLDLERDRWSQFGAWEFRAVNGDRSLSPSFTPDLQDFYGAAPDYGLQTAGLALKDAWRIKAGAEYRLAPHFALRGGFAHYQSPAGNSNQNPIDPVPDQNIAAVGFGFEGPVFSIYQDKEIGELSLDVYFRYALSRDGGFAASDYALSFQAQRWEAGVGVGFGF